MSSISGYLCEACRNAAARIVKQSRCVSELTDKEGNRKYIARRRELTPQIAASLEDTRDADERLRQFRRDLWGRAADRLPPADRDLYERYHAALETVTGRRFLLENRDWLASLGIDSYPKLRHRIHAVKARIRAISTTLID